MLVDTHCHLFKKYFDNIDLVLDNARKKNVGIFISASDNISSSKEMLDLARKYENIYVCLGVHPSSIDENLLELEKLLDENKNFKKIVAIGEIGLDYYYGKDSKDEQIRIFERQLELAEKYSLPVVIHSREATKDTLEILKKYNVKGVIHSFNGSLETAKEYIKMGYKLGVNGLITFKNCRLKETIKELDLQDLVLETDSPYLTPEPFRKNSNEPMYVSVVADFLADLFQVSLNTVSEITTENACELFDIDYEL